MKCTSCNNEISDTSIFCSYCGVSAKAAPESAPAASTGSKCVNCGFESEEKVRFCRQCGKNLDDAPATAPAGISQPADITVPVQPLSQQYEQPQPPPLPQQIVQPPPQQYMQPPPSQPPQQYMQPPPAPPPQQYMQPPTAQPPPQQYYTHPQQQQQPYYMPQQPYAPQRKSTAKRKIIIGVIVAICVIAAGVVAYTTILPRLNNQNRGNTVGNIENWGLAAIDGGRIFYVNIEDSGYIYSMKTDGSDVQRLNNLDSMYINILNGWVYFSAWGEPGSGETGIYKMRTNGSDLQKLNGNDAHSLIVIGNKIYYVNMDDEDRIYCIDTDGNNRERLNNDPVDCMNVVGNLIFYKNYGDSGSGYSGRINVMGTDGSDNRRVTDDDVYCHNVIGDTIYYINYDDLYLYSIKTDGTNRQRIGNDEVWRINVSGNTIYYVNGSDNGRLYSMRSDGSNKQRLNNDDSGVPNVVGDWIIYMKWDTDGDTPLYAIRTDGTGRRIISGSSNRTNSQTGDDPAINIPEPAPPAPAPVPAPASPAPAPAPPAPAPIPAVITINMEPLRMIGKTNADLIAVNGRQGNSGQFDGGAWIGYERMSVPFPLLFGVEMDLDIFLDIIYNDNLNWNTNIWPDFAVVSSLLLWREQIDFVFQYDSPVTYEALCDVMTVIYDLYYLSEEDQLHDPWGFDVWSCTFRFGSYEMYATFEKVGTDLVLIEGLIWATGT